MCVCNYLHHHTQMNMYRYKKNHMKHENGYIYRTRTVKSKISLCCIKKSCVIHQNLILTQVLGTIIRDNQINPKLQKQHTTTKGVINTSNVLDIRVVSTGKMLVLLNRTRISATSTKPCVIVNDPYRLTAIILVQTISMVLYNIESGTPAYI